MSEEVINPGPRAGRCHICQEVRADIEYCPVCDHWFGVSCCRPEWWKRIAAASYEWFERLFLLKEIDWRTQRCCGPEVER